MKRTFSRIADSWYIKHYKTFTKKRLQFEKLGVEELSLLMLSGTSLKSRG